MQMKWNVDKTHADGKQFLLYISKNIVTQIIAQCIIISTT